MTYDLTTSTISTLSDGDIINCPYSGSAKSVTLPKGVYKLEVWGAEGGYRSNQTYSGKGGYSTGVIMLKTNTVVYCYAGGSGATGGMSGGFNGGGKRSSYNGGGGASDIRIGSDSLYARVIVAGGGGSDGATSKQGMYGGGETGGSSTQSYGSGGYGGGQTGVSSSSWQTTTQSSSTTSNSDAYAGFGFGGNGVYRSNGYGGAGGGGWYGGSGSYPDGSGDDDRGGGGGSGYTYTSSTASNYPSGCLLNSDYYLTETSMIAGNATLTTPTGTSQTGNTGDGYVRITLLYKNIPIDAAIYMNVNGEIKQSLGQYIKIDNHWRSFNSLKYMSNDEWNTFNLHTAIPYDARIEYIESTGTQWIDTGIIPTETTGIRVDAYRKTSDDTYIVGLRNTSGSTRWAIGQANYRYYYCYGDYSSSSTTYETRAVLDLNYLNDKYFRVKNYSTLADNNSLSLPSLSFTPSYPIRLFGASGYAADQSYGKWSGRLYYVKITQGSELVMDLIPVRVGTEGCLYDKVSGELFHNAGTGSFVCGNDITPIEYLQSSGSQYINTNVYITQYPIKVETRVYFTGSNSEQDIFGNYSSNTGSSKCILAGKYDSSFHVWTGSRWTPAPLSLSTWYDVSFESKNSSAIEMSINGTKYTTTQSHSATSSDSPIYLLCAGSSKTSYLTGRIGFMKIYDNNVLVRDYVPVRCGTVGYMYDQLNDVLYPNAGSGSFTLGPDIVN